jgi:glycosyltransferase involved in cell wall biosynthesis
MKIAFICQPWTVARPTLECDSIGIWTYQVARRLNQKAKILFYGGQKYDAPPVYNHEGIEYRGIKLGFDKFTKVFEYLDLWQLTAPQKPFFASTFYYSNYIKKIAKDLQKQQCDLIHIHNFSQFVPIIKTFNPNSKIVLHMHCEWLTQLDWQTIEKRLNLVDLVIGCSDYITDKIIKHFPHLATRFVSVANGVDTDLFFPKNRDYQQQKNKELLYVAYIQQVNTEIK